MSWLILAGIYLFICGAALLADALEGPQEPQNRPSETRTERV